MTTHEDRQLGRKIMKPMKGLMILGKEGMPQYATQGSQQLDQKVNETYGRSNAHGEGGMPQYIMMNRQRCKMPQNYYTLRYAHPSCNENVQPQISNAKQDHALRHHADKTKMTDE